MSLELRRVVAMLDSASNRGQVAGAAQLARLLDANLSALFIEHEDQLRAASLPCSDLVGHSGAIVPFDSSQLTRVFRASAQRAREEVGRAAEHLSLTWSFDVLRTSWLEALQQESRPGALSVFGELPSTALPARALLVAPDAEAAEHLLEALSRVSAFARGHLVAAGSPAALTAFSAARDAGQVHELRPLPTPHATESSLLNLVRQVRPSLVLAPARGPWWNENLLRSWHLRARSAVMLVP